MKVPLQCRDSVYYCRKCNKSCCAYCHRDILERATRLCVTCFLEKEKPLALLKNNVLLNRLRRESVYGISLTELMYIWENRTLENIPENIIRRYCPSGFKREKEILNTIFREN